MIKRSLGWLCLMAACATLMLFVGVPIMAADNSGTSGHINLDLRDTDVRSAVEAFFRNSGKNYTIDANVKGIIPAISIKDVPFDIALKSLMKSAGLVYRQDGGIYIISVKPDITQMPAPPQYNQPDVPYEPTTAEPEIRIEKITLNNLSALEILSILQGNNVNGGNYGGYGMQTGMYGNGMGMGMGMGMSGFGGGYGSYGGGYGVGNYGGQSYGGYGGYSGGNYGGYSNRNNGHRNW